MPPFVCIKLAGAGAFAVLDIEAGDTVGRVTKRACGELKSWKVDAAAGATLPRPA
jgi:hypothetical protein